MNLASGRTLLRAAIPSYRLRLLVKDDRVQDERTAAYPDDDAAIDSVGELGHQHVIELTQADRVVARFPSRPARTPIDEGGAPKTEV